MSTIIQLTPICPSCDHPHASQLDNCPICERVWKQGRIGELGVMDGLSLGESDNVEDYGYAAYVLCGCGYTGPSEATCEGAIKAWNENAQLVRARIEQGGPLQSNAVLDRLHALGILPQQEAA